MFLVSNITAVEAAASSVPAPIPASEALLALYPGATIDAQGRAHAPCEGYTVDEVAYHAGEYLPFPENAKDRGNSKVWVAASVSAEPVVFEGARDVIGAIREEAKRQETSVDLQLGFVGEVGKRGTMELTLFSVFSEPGQYGWSHAHVFRTGSGERVLYKGGNILAKIGQRISVKATVSAHHVGKDGRKSTIIKRPS